ncbi:MAG: hypothetical protein ABI882_08400 [Acidobacteriota bacterium]
MPVCPSCGSEFRAGFTECNTCRIPLVASLVESEEDEPEFIEEGGEETLHLLGTLEEDAQAMLLRRLLDDAAIPSILQGGHGVKIGECVPYRILVDEDYLDAARETISAYQAPGLITGQIEGALARLSNELGRIARERKDLSSKVKAINESSDQLRKQLEELNHDLED